MEQTARGERFILIGIALFTLALRAIAFFHLRFDSDEPQHLHVTWGWTAGLLQYRDVFDNHAPLFHILTAPFLKIIGERPDALLYMRAPILILFAIVLWVTYVLGKRLYNQRIAIWSVLLLALFPVFFLKSIEYRNDNLWNAFWCLALLVLTGGAATAPRLFLTGVLLGCAMAASMKTLLIVITLGVSGIVTYALRRRPIARAIRPSLIALAGTAVVPAIIVAYYAAQHALANLYYCVIQFNELAAADLTASEIWVKRIAFVPAIGVILWIAWQKRPQTDDWQAAWRFFFAFACAFYSAALVGFWLLISPRDLLSLYPLLAIFLAAAIDRLDIRVPVYLATCLLFVAGIWYYGDHLELRTDEHITMMRQVLGVTRPGEPVLDLKGETVFRPRPYYYILEFITRRAMLHNLVRDTIPEDVVRTNCHVAQADGPFFPPRGREFLRANFIDLGRIRAAGQWIKPDGSFTIAVPGEYVILNSNGEAQGALDGSPYRGKRMLQLGAHTFVTAGTNGEVACLWAPAFERGYSPFHLRDREFNGSPVFDSARDRFGPASGRRRHRRWWPHSTRPRGAR